jgi:hypothetical protein
MHRITVQKYAHECASIRSGPEALFVTLSRHVMASHGMSCIFVSATYIPAVVDPQILRADQPARKKKPRGSEGA